MCVCCHRRIRELAGVEEEGAFKSGVFSTLRELNGGDEADDQDDAAAEKKGTDGEKHKEEEEEVRQRACVCACVCACVRVCVCACACVLNL